MNPHADPRDEDLRGLLLEIVGYTERPDWQLRASKQLARFGTRPAAEPDYKAMYEELAQQTATEYHAKLDEYSKSPQTERPAPADGIEEYVALAERCGAEVGRYEGQMVWMKFHRQSSVEAFVTGIAMLAALSRQAPAAPAEADPAGDNPWHDAPTQQDTKPAFWVLTEQLRKRETTHLGYMWFVDPQNSAWTPVYTAIPPSGEDNHA